MPAQVLTQHNNNSRTGVNDAETILTPAAVRTRFHKLFAVRVDPPEEGGPSAWASQIVAQPLIVSAVPWSDGAQKDLLLIATMHGTVYAYDAGQDCARLWATWLGPPILDFTDAMGNVQDEKDRYGTNPEWGILSTLVIDPSRRCVYVVMWHNERGGTYRLHALDLVTGQEIMPSAVIAGMVADATGQTVAFDPVLHKQRPGLLLVAPADLAPAHASDVASGGTIYIAFGASIETSMYHGWVFAYDVDSVSARFTQRAVWCATPNGSGAGVWQAGAGLASDVEGSIHLMTGNGDVDAAQHNYGQSFVKLACKDLQVLSWFTPWNWADLNTGDRDLGSAGPVAIPGTNFLIGAGKVGILYCLDRTNLGGTGDAATHKNPSIDEVQATGDPPHPNIDHDHHVHGSPVYFQPLSRLYLWGENDVLKAFTIDRTSGHFSPTPVATGRVVAPEGMPGGMLSLSANARADAILWAALPISGDANKQRLVDGVLRAFDATTLEEIWNSDRDTDRLGHFAKFASPTVANGRVYVPTYDGTFVVYGLVPRVERWRSLATRWLRRARPRVMTVRGQPRKEPKVPLDMPTPPLVPGGRARGGYLAALVATSVLVPAISLIAGIVFYFIQLYPIPHTLSNRLSSKALNTLDLLAAFVVALLGWFIVAAWCRGFTTAASANSAAYGELSALFGDIDSRLQATSPPPPSDADAQSCAHAYAQATRHAAMIRAALSAPEGNLAWVTATGYIAAWQSLHRLQEALLIFDDCDEVIAAARYDELRLKGSKIQIADDLLETLRYALSAFQVPPPSGIRLQEPPPCVPVARALLSGVRRTINEYRDEARDGLVRARNRLKVTGVITGLATFLLLALIVIVLSDSRDRDSAHLVTATILFFVGVIVGLFNRLYLDAQANAAIEDFGLGTTRLISTPLLSGLAAVGGVLVAALLPSILVGVVPATTPVTPTPPMVVATPTGTSSSLATATLTAIGSPTPTSTSASGGSVTPTAISTPGGSEFSLPPARTSTLRDIFDVNRYPFEVVIAAIFALTPGLLISRLQQQTENFTENLSSTQPAQQDGRRGG